MLVVAAIEDSLLARMCLAGTAVMENNTLAIGTLELPMPVSVGGGMTRLSTLV